MKRVPSCALYLVACLFNCGLARPAPATLGFPPPTIFLARDLSDATLIQLGALTGTPSANPTLAPQAVLLLDTPETEQANRAYLAHRTHSSLLAIGTFPGGVADIRARLGTGQMVVRVHATKDDLPPDLWSWGPLDPRSNIVVCPPEPREQLLQAACLAGSLRAPLFLHHGGAFESAVLRERVEQWQTKRVHFVGSTQRYARDVPGFECVVHADEQAVARAHRAELSRRGPIGVIVVTNPHDTTGTNHSALAPHVAVQKGAALLLTAPDGKDVKQLVETAVRQPALRKVDALLLLGDLKAIPMEQRANPIADGKDPLIDMEPLTPLDREPVSFATGRLFHYDRAMVPLLLARQRLLAESVRKPRALVASNYGNSLPLLETFSRQTARELRNAGYETTALFGARVTEEAVRRGVTQNDIILWEGHYSTLFRDWRLPEWDEPMAPSLVFLQSCLALRESKAQPLIDRGAVAIIGSSTRTYSASGGAASLAFFDAVVYDGQSVGGALRQSKNFLLAYSLLKEKRLGKDAQRTGANLRAAWAFTLWGDPTLHLPHQSLPADASPPVSHVVRGNTITLLVPPERPDKVLSSKYQAATPTNARLAGLLHKGKDDDGQALVPLLFAEVTFLDAKRGLTPQLTSKLPSSHWVFNWDARRGCGYLLVEPRARDDNDLRFHVEWQTRDERRVASGE